MNIEYNADFTKQILYIDVHRPYLKKKKDDKSGKSYSVLFSTFQASWEVTNTGIKEFGNDCGLTVVKGNEYIYCKM